MSNETTYTATLILSSTGDENGVTMKRELSHSILDLLAEGKQMPASYEAMREVMNYVRLTGTRDSFNLTDEELAALPPEEQVLAIRKAAREAANTIVVNRIN